MHVEAEPLDRLRLRTSAKWQLFPPDVLPLFVAEMDYPLAPAIVARMHALLDLNDSGYVATPAELGVAFAGFASRRWGWRLDPSMVRTTTDVSVGIVETLRGVIAAGDGVIITSPVYAPFADLVREAGGVVVDIPLAEDRSFDLPALDAALASGAARAILISNPHNPLGYPHSPESLTALAEVAARHGVWVVSDEIHGPLVHAGEKFTPFLSVSDAARRWGVTITSASKAFNLAGFKCCVMVAASPEALAVLDGMYDEVAFRTSILGYHASVAAFADSEDWLG
jgi:cystathionine beta-lyase